MQFNARKFKLDPNDAGTRKCYGSQIFTCMFVLVQLFTKNKHRNWILKVYVIQFSRELKKVIQQKNIV